MFLQPKKYTFIPVPAPRLHLQFEDTPAKAKGATKSNDKGKAKETKTGLQQSEKRNAKEVAANDGTLKTGLSIHHNADAS